MFSAHVRSRPFIVIIPLGLLYGVVIVAALMAGFIYLLSGSGTTTAVNDSGLDIRINTCVDDALDLAPGQRSDFDSPHWK